MIYLLQGEDSQAKYKKIAELKSSFLKEGDALFFDFEALDAQYLNAATLKKSLIALPSFSPKRVVLIRNLQKLKVDAAAVLLAAAADPKLPCEIILESTGELKGNLKDIALHAKVFSLGVKAEMNVFDVTKLMSARKTAEALKMLHSFYSNGMYPLQMMGALIWYWGKEGRALGHVRFEKGLRALEEADLNIKRSRLQPEYAVEKLVVELVELQKG